MVGPQTALKAIWASLLKQPPEAAHVIRGVDGGELTGDYLRCSIPNQTIGTWTTKISRLPTTGGWHAMVYTRLAEYSFERDDFLLLARSTEDAPALHHRFLDRRSPLPLHHSWANLALAPGSAHRRDRPPPVLRDIGLGLLPQWRESSGTTCRTPWPWALSP